MVLSMRSSLILGFIGLLSIVSTYKFMNRGGTKIVITGAGSGGAGNTRYPPPQQHPYGNPPLFTPTPVQPSPGPTEEPDAAVVDSLLAVDELIPSADAEPLTPHDAAARMYSPNRGQQQRRHMGGGAATAAAPVCAAESSQFPTGRQLLIVDDVTTESDITVIARVAHSQHDDGSIPRTTKPPTPVVPLDKFSPYCNLLDKRMWIECPTNAVLNRERAHTRPCTRTSYIARHTCSFVDARAPPELNPRGGEPGAVSAGVGATGRGVSLGTVFDSWRQFLPMKNAHIVRTDSSLPAPKVISYPKLATVLTAHWNKPNYWLRETLPRVLFLLANIPRDVPILVGTPPKSLLEALSAKGIDTSRFVFHTGDATPPSASNAGTVYFANELYYASEWPLCESQNPTHLFRATFHPKELLDPVRALFVPTRVPPLQRQKLVVIRRDNVARKYNVDSIIDELRSKWPKLDVVYFDDNFANTRPFMDHVELFSRAKVVLGPHSAGLANQLWCAPGTVIYEAGYDQCLDGCMDDEYYEMAIALGHEYFTGLGGGPHTETNELWPGHVMHIFKDGGQSRDHSNVKPRHQLNVVTDPSQLPPEIPDPVLVPGTYGGPPLPADPLFVAAAPTTKPTAPAKPTARPRVPAADTITLDALPDCNGRDSFPLGATLRAVTDVYAESDVTIVKEVDHSDYGKLPIWGSPTDKFDQYCGLLDKRIWIECPADDSVKRAKVRPCTKKTYIPRHECSFVDSASVHPAVPGTVFDQTRMFMPLKYVRPAKTDYASLKDAGPIIRYDRLAHVLSPYPGAPGHYPHEVLPRLIWLHQTLPAAVKILVPIIPKYIDALVSRGILDRDRLVPWEKGTVYFARELYYANEWPFCDQPDNPHQGGEPTFYPSHIMANARKAFVGKTLPDSERQTTVLIQRKSSRALQNHDELANALESNFPDMKLVVFDDAYVKRPYEDHIKLFQSAKIIIAPHGAGLSNIMYAAPDTVVIEIAFDKCEVMCIDEMYYQLAASLDQDYWLLIAAGTYSSKMVLHVPHLINLFLNGGQKGPNHQGIKPKHNPNVIGGARAHALPAPRTASGAVVVGGAGNKVAATCDHTFPLNVGLRQVKDIVKEIADDPASGIEIVLRTEHKLYGKMPIFGTPHGKWESTCAKMERKVWIECPDPNGGDAGRATTRPCTQMTYIAKHRCAWIDHASVHDAVPGTVFDKTRSFTPLMYVRPAKTDYGQVNAIPRVIRLNKVAHVLTPYPGAPGHYPHEVLPRLLWLHKHLPADVKIVVPFVAKYLDVLIERGELSSKQLVAHEGGSIYFGQEVYYVNEWPFCEQRNPHQGGEPTFYPTEIMNGLRTAFVGPTLPLADRQSTVIIKRGGSRALSNHDNLVSELKSAFPRIKLEIFDDHFAHHRPFEEHIKLFSRAKVIIAPHGAGLSNIMYAAPGSVVIEIGFDSCGGMCNDEMYYQLAQSLGLDYWMILSNGSYGGPITVQVADVIDLLKNGGQRGVDTQRVKASRTPDVDA